MHFDRQEAALSLFDHTPVTVTDAYGPSIHLDPVAMDNSALRGAGIRDVAADTTGVTIEINATDLVDAILLRLAAHSDDRTATDALEDLHDTARDDGDIDSRLRVVRDVVGLAPRDVLTVTLHGTTAVLLAERLIDEAGPAALAAREALTLSRADFLDHAGAR